MPPDLSVDILAFGAHPDDIEFGCGGILAKLASQGKKIVLADLTVGEKGTNGTPEIRQSEGIEAARIIGAERLYLGFSDCEVFDTYEGRLKLTAVIRKYRPKLILTPYWKGEMNHPDHLATGLMTRHAFRYARLAKILPDLPTFQPDGLMHYLYPTLELVDFLVDVTDHMDTWKAMMAHHVSQHKTFDFTAWNLLHAARLGTLIGKPYAQGLVKGTPVIVEDLMSVSKCMRHT